MPNRPVPRPTPETAEFWAGTRRGELRIQRCRACRKAYFYPRPICPHCNSTDVDWFTASGRGRLYSYVINHRAPPNFRDIAPYVIAVVELEEGPRMMTNVVDCEFDALEIGMPLRAVYYPTSEDVTIVQFRPATGS